MPNRRDPPIGDRLADMITGLRATGMRPDEIARASGLTRTTIWRFENGMTGQPSFQSVQQIQELFSKHCQPPQKR